MNKVFRPVWIALLLAAAAGVFGLLFLDQIAPFDLNRPPNILTKLHLQLLDHQPGRCLAALDRANVDYQAVPPRSEERGCGFENAVRLHSSGVNYGSRILLQCPAMLAVLLWERHVLAPAAEEHFARKLASVRQLGTYACRNIGGEKGRALSEHAYANAIDIAGFTLEGGESISIRRDWGDSGEKSRFLRDVRDGACEIFSATLSPDYNRAHADHFHLDMGQYDVCR